MIDYEAVLSRASSQSRTLRDQVCRQDVPALIEECRRLEGAHAPAAPAKPVPEEKKKK